MAIGGTPVGNMVIKVDLDSVGVEKSMTGLQRQLKSSNKAMGAQLSAFDRGEKSTQKYGVMIDGLSNRHRIQAGMVDEARAKYDHMSETYGENSVKAQQASQELNEQIARYQETGRELDNMTTEFQEFQRVQEIQSKGWYKVADGMDNWGGKMKDAGRSMDQTGKKLTRGVSVPLGIVGGLAVKTGVDFEAGMSKVGAVSGASADEMQQLEAKAREMGSTTVFSAKESSDAFYYMSLAGWDASEMMDGISGVMDLAAASGEDLAQVSDIVTDGLTAFGLEAKDSGRMADVLAAASANANTDVAGLGSAFAYVAPIAGSLGYSMEDTSKAIGLMSNSGIKAQKAGTALRTMMTKLGEGTDESKAKFAEYGVSLTDGEGNMKSFDDVMKDLRKGVGGLSEDQQAQAASTLFGKEAMSGALAIINASEEDYEKLTGAIEGSDGAASEMAETMQDNLAGSMKELKSMVEDLFIEMYQNLKPTIETVIDSAKDLTEWFSNLSTETQANIAKFGMVAIAAGPVLSLFGKLTFGTGALVQVTGSLAKTIGLSKSAGALGALSGLGKAGVVGLAIAGVGALGYATYKYIKKAKESKEVNLDSAESFSKQAGELEKSADTFDKLSDKAKISNEQLAELNDLNIRISESSNPGEIKELQKQYDALAEKSGLSKDELKNLFKANENIIEQSPDVEKSVSDQGNAFADNTEEVQKQIQALRDLSEAQLKGERVKLLEQEEQARKTILEKTKEQEKVEERMLFLADNANLSKDELNERIAETEEKLKGVNRNSEEGYELDQEHTDLINIKKERIGETVDDLNDQNDELQDSIDKEQEKIDKLDATEQKMANVYLANVGINEEGEKGLEKLDKSISKSDEELEKLNNKLEANGKLTQEEQERYDTLTETNGKQKEARDLIFEELGLYKDVNSLAEQKLDSLDSEGQKQIEILAKKADIKVEEGNIIKQLDSKNKKHLEEIELLEENKKKNGANKKEIDKQIDAIGDKIRSNDDVKKQILEELGIWDDVKGSINLSSNNIDKKNTKSKTGASILKDQSTFISDQIRGLKGASSQQSRNNSKIDTGAKSAKTMTDELSKDVNKNVKTNLNPTVANINKALSKPVSKRINVSQKMVGSFGGSSRSVRAYAKGTPSSGHPGGMAVVGDGGGRELIQTPSGASFLSPDTDTMLNLPKGTHVMPHRETERILKNTPHYANGIGDFNFENLRNSEFMKLLALAGKSLQKKVRTTDQDGRNKKENKEDKTLKNLLQATLEQNQILMQILKKDNTAVIGFEEVYGPIKSRLNEDKYSSNKQRRRR